ncbi:glycosyltransferase [Glaciihabitans sp. UYNi722]|uniref:glycosyltransferase n=1 Tax=Glaciihabitans sp. UYNi722 TaxID=3156344 RepID=UPI0033928B91
MAAIRAVAVVIPARDEEKLIRRCLESVRAAVGHAAMTSFPVPRILVVLVADRCTDQTVAIGREFSEVSVLEVDAANVGIARGAGIRYALATLDKPLPNVWIANTDADSVVPTNWITTQLDLAKHKGVMVGTVRPDFAELLPHQIEAWKLTHIPGKPNGHVHGANLGVRADLYRSAGGFARVTEHEDNLLVSTLKDSGVQVIASDSCEVMTSARREGRTPGGYAEYLRMALATG